jgi:hypothetical protein
LLTTQQPSAGHHPRPACYNGIQKVFASNKRIHHPDGRIAPVRWGSSAALSLGKSALPLVTDNPNIIKTFLDSELIPHMETQVAQNRAHTLAGGRSQYSSGIPHPCQKRVRESAPVLSKLKAALNGRRVAEAET